VAGAVTGAVAGPVAGAFAVRCPHVCLLVEVATAVGTASLPLHLSCPWEGPVAVSLQPCLP